MAEALSTSVAVAYLKALRPHQWLKNLLLFLPALAGHEFSERTLVPALIAFVSFSFAASSMYALNDWIHLPMTAHTRKNGTGPLLQAKFPRPTPSSYLSSWRRSPFLWRSFYRDFSF